MHAATSASNAFFKNSIRLGTLETSRYGVTVWYPSGIGLTAICTTSKLTFVFVAMSSSNGADVYGTLVTAAVQHEHDEGRPGRRILPKLSFSLIIP